MKDPTLKAPKKIIFLLKAAISPNTVIPNLGFTEPLCFSIHPEGCSKSLQKFSKQNLKRNLAVPLLEFSPVDNTQKFSLGYIIYTYRYQLQKGFRIVFFF